MSTKIYDGFKLGVNRISTFCDLALAESIQNAAEKIIYYHSTQYTDLYTSIDSYIKNYTVNSIGAFNLNSGYNLWIVGQTVYGYHYGRCSIPGIQLAKFVLEYQYQDSSDKPERYTVREWNERSRVWDRNLAKYEQRLQLRTVDMLNTHSVMLLTEEILKRVMQPEK